MGMTLIRRIILAITALIGLFAGSWAAFLPQSFYDSFPGVGFGPWVAVDGPYNEHLVRDVGALYLALAAASIYAAVVMGVQASRAVGIAWLVFSVPHLTYHLHHLEGFTPLDAVGQVVALGSTVVLAIPLIFTRSARSKETQQ
jgi:hypothetical protein